MSSPKIEASIAEVLQKGETTRVMISMTEKTEDALKDFENREFADRTERLNALNQELTSLADTSQKALIELLEREKGRIPITWSSLWISNQLIVENVDLKLAEAIAAIANVEKIEGESHVELLQ